MSEGTQPYQPRLVGTTADLYQFSIAETPENTSLLNKHDGDGVHSSAESNFFKSAQWSPDGTTILTSSADSILKSFVLPAGLLHPTSSTPQCLIPYALHPTPEPTYATAFHPSYDLQAPTSTLFLASLRTLPIRLVSPFTSVILASYPLVSPTTEHYIAPHSLLFSSDNANQFFAGSESLISTFDITRNGEGPLNRMPTIPSRRNKSVGGGGGMKGIVSALGMSREGLLAAGTFSRWVGLYDGHGRGGTVGVFEIRDHGRSGDEEGGTGITQVLWSACGRYLCCVERGSDGVGIWDVRGTGKRLAWLRKRRAKTNQRMNVDIVGSEIWAGGTDGMVRVWEGLGMNEGVVDPILEFQAHDDAVSSTIVHPSGSVLATSSGQRHFATRANSENKSESDSTSDLSSLSSEASLSSSGSLSKSLPVRTVDNSLKIWAL